MADFLKSQLDYIFFVYGAAFFLLIPLCLFLNQRPICGRLAWVWLGWFGATHGANEWLDACGFPLCKGEIMAGNPKWCLSLEEWQHTFGDWIFRGDAPVLLNASIFFDFRPLAGDARLAEGLRAWLTGKIKENRLFLRLMVQNAL